MASIAEVIQRVLERIRELAVDAGLQDDTPRVSHEEPASYVIATVRHLLADRRQALRKAQQTVDQLSNTVLDLARMLPFTEAGWPERRTELRDQLDDNLPAAVGAWLDYWFTAAVDRRLEALDRLEREVALPPGGALVADRARAAAQGLRQDRWELAAPMLHVGVAGLDLAGRRVPDVETSERLRLLLARIALSEKLVEEARGLLEAPGGADGTAARLALRARLARITNDAEAADSLLGQAQEIDPRDLDVTVELIHRARQENELPSALDAARVAVDALLSLADVETDLGKLITVPPELWVAAAERSAREGDKATAADLLNRAFRDAAGEDHEIWAIIHEARAKLATTNTDYRRDLVAAGQRWIDANQVERAQLDFEAAAAGEAAAVDEEEKRQIATAQLCWADTVAVLAWPRPISAVRSEVEKALDGLLTARTRIDVTTSESLSYLIETALRHQLARNLDPRRPVHEWTALLAAARAVALDPAQSMCWLNLSTAAEEIWIFRVGETSARRAFQLQLSDATRSGYGRVLINVGNYDTALKILGDVEDQWSQCARGCVTLRLGDHVEAIRLLEKVTIDPTWQWAWGAYVSALVISGDLERAQHESRSFARALVDNSGERTALWSALFDTRIRGEFVLSLERSREFHELAGPLDDEASGELGQALVLSGDPSGWELIKRSLRHRPTRHQLDSWERVTRPVLEALVAGYDLAPLEFETLDPTLSEVRQELIRPVTPVAELRQAAAQAAETPVAAQAALLTEVVLDSIAPADSDALERALRPLTGMTEFAAETAALRRHGLAQLAEARQRAQARRAVDDAVSGSVAAAADSLRALLAEVPAQVAALLQSEAAGTIPEQLLALLWQLRDEPEYSDSVRDVLTSLDADHGDERDPGTQFQLLLPASWFADVTDPVREHPLLVRFLPELRLRVDWLVPPVNIAAYTEFEPASYLVVTDDGVLARGSVDPGLRYCVEGALPLLAPGVRSDPRTHPTPHGWGVPADLLDGDQTSRAELFTMSAAEVVARILGEVVRTSRPPAKVRGRTNIGTGTQD